MGQEARAAEESAAALKNGGCFVAGTPVQMADGSSRPIERIQKGDVVMSRNPATGKAHARRVARTFVHQHPGTLVLTLDSGETIETTPEHPFFKLGVGFVPAASLGIGTSIVTRAGPPTHITNVERKDATATVYNLEVEDDHTYFVGKSDGGVWVHNACNLGDLTPGEVERLQGIADEFGQPIGVFGSAARGERRGLGTDLPIGKGPGTRSDLDLGVPMQMRGGPMEEALAREFKEDLERHGVMSYFPPAGPGEIEITPRGR